MPLALPDMPYYVFNADAAHEPQAAVGQPQAVVGGPQPQAQKKPRRTGKKFLGAPGKRSIATKWAGLTSPAALLGKSQLIAWRD